MINAPLSAADPGAYVLHAHINMSAWRERWIRPSVSMHMMKVVEECQSARRYSSSPHGPLRPFSIFHKQQSRMVQTMERQPATSNTITWCKIFMYFYFASCLLLSVLFRPLITNHSRIRPVDARPHGSSRIYRPYVDSADIFFSRGRRTTIGSGEHFGGPAVAPD